MPLTRFIADALDVVTICLVAVFVLLGLFCALHLFYFRNEIRSQGLVQLNFFNGPWIIRITYIFFAGWWGIGEIIRLNLLRRRGRILHALSLKWQENVCKCYIVSNLGFAEPCLFLTLIFLLRASLQRSGTLSQNWNLRTAGFVLLFCFPMVILQLVIILIAPRPEKVVFDAIVFLAFLSLLCCACVGICMLVYLPIADSLALRNLHKDTEARTGGDECNDSTSLIANQSPAEGGTTMSSPARNSSASSNRGSISFRTKEKDNASGAGFVELSLFTPSQHSSPPGSPRLLSWPMISPLQGQEP
ncbi:UNVERIFIED_CONTAM: hypothetical protein Sangu_1047900 [Sesamum angustifolium]|uniref:Uncharacterized protein n=1 Tax=Sesamum angustifolium TaxID=2727405 RepID=A0AAW2P046_9LAMI